jgi:hypothetical protein
LIMLETLRLMACCCLSFGLTLLRFYPVIPVSLTERISMPQRLA